MAKRRKLDPATEKPTCKSDIDRYYIVSYTKLYGTPEQRQEMKEFIKSHTVERTSQLTKKPYTDIQLKACREKFCELFFPQFNTPKGKRTFFDEVDDL